MVRYSTPNRGFPAGNPLANILVVVVGAIIIAASVLLGFLAFVVLASIILVMAAIIGVRVWWLNRKLSRQRPNGPGGSSEAGVIEGEYHVVIEERDEHR